MPEMQEHFPAMWLMALQRATENTPDGTSSCHGVAGLVGIYQDGSRPERRSWNFGPRTMSDMTLQHAPANTPLTTHPVVMESRGTSRAERVGAGSWFQAHERHGCRDSAPMAGFTACSVTSCPHPSAPATGCPVAPF